MPGTKKATAKTGVMHYALEEESKNQRRILLQGMAKDQMKITSQSDKNWGAQNPSLDSR